MRKPLKVAVSFVVGVSLTAVAAPDKAIQHTNNCVQQSVIIWNPLTVLC